MSEHELTIRLLGPVEVSHDATTIALPPSRKVRALLGYLFASERPHGRSALSALLWEGAKDPRAGLRWALTKLREVVNRGERRPLLTSRDRVGFDLDQAWIDLLEVRCVGPDDPLERLEGAVAAFGGEFLEGLDLPGCHDFHSWCVGVREDVRSHHVSLRKALVARLRADPEAALPHALARLRLEPFDEAARVEAIGLLSELGRFDRGVEIYQRFRRVLAEELGTEPSPALEDARRRLERPSAKAAIRAPPLGGRGHPTKGEASDPARPDAASLLAALPPPEGLSEPAPDEPPLVGREREWRLAVDSVSAALERATPTTVLITGEPGIGKTRLLRELVREVRSRSGWVSWGPCSRRRAFGRTVPGATWCARCRPAWWGTTCATTCRLCSRVRQRPSAARDRPSRHACSRRWRACSSGPLPRTLRGWWRSTTSTGWTAPPRPFSTSWLVGEATRRCCWRSPRARRRWRTTRRKRARSARSRARGCCGASSSGVSAARRPSGWRRPPVAPTHPASSRPARAIPCSRWPCWPRSARAPARSPPAWRRSFRADWGGCDRAIVRCCPGPPPSAVRSTRPRSWTSSTGRRPTSWRRSAAWSAAGSYGPRGRSATTSAIRFCGTPPTGCCRSRDDERCTAPSRWRWNAPRSQPTLRCWRTTPTSAACRSGRRATIWPPPSTPCGCWRSTRPQHRLRADWNDWACCRTSGASPSKCSCFGCTGSETCATCAPRMSRRRCAASPRKRASPGSARWLPSATPCSPIWRTSGARSRMPPRAPCARPKPPWTASRTRPFTRWPKLAPACSCSTTRRRTRDASPRRRSHWPSATGVEVDVAALARALMHHHDGEHDEALRSFEEVVLLGERDQDRWWASPALTRMAMVELDRGDGRAAVERAAEAERLAKRLGDESETAFAKALAAIAREDGAMPGEASSSGVGRGVDEALKQLRVLDSLWHVAHVQLYAAEADLRRGRPEAARERAEEAARAARDLSQPSLAAQARALMAEAALARGAVDEAARNLDAPEIARPPHRLTHRARRTLRRVHEAIGR